MKKKNFQVIYNGRVYCNVLAIILILYKQILLKYSYKYATSYSTILKMFFTGTNTACFGLLEKENTINSSLALSIQATIMHHTIHTLIHTRIINNPCQTNELDCSCVPLHWSLIIIKPFLYYVLSTTYTRPYSYRQRVII